MQNDGRECKKYVFRFNQGNRKRPSISQGVFKLGLSTSGNVRFLQINVWSLVLNNGLLYHHGELAMLAMAVSIL